MKDIQKSIEIIKNSNLEYIFRTTIVPGLIKAEDIDKIGNMLHSSKIYQIQQFVPITTVDESYQRKKPLPKEEIQELAGIAKAYFSEVKIEGV